MLQWKRENKQWLFLNGVHIACYTYRSFNPSRLAKRPCPFLLSTMPHYIICCMYGLAVEVVRGLYKQRMWMPPTLLMNRDCNNCRVVHIIRRCRACLEHTPVIVRMLDMWVSMSWFVTVCYVLSEWIIWCFALVRCCCLSSNLILKVSLLTVPGGFFRYLSVHSSVVTPHCHQHLCILGPHGAITEKVKASRTRYRALDPGLIPVYRQSAQGWL